MNPQNKQEYIICAAIHFDDGFEYTHNPKNIKTGSVLMSEDLY